MGLRTKKWKWCVAMTGALAAALLIAFAASKVQAVSDSGSSCDEIQYSMTALLNQYLGVKTLCRFLIQDGRANSEMYRQQSHAARDLENRYLLLVNRCDSNCSDKVLCNGFVPSGACIDR